MDNTSPGAGSGFRVPPDLPGCSCAVNMVLSMDRWRGKVAVVTGASSGIGAAIAEALVKEGLLVVGLARRVEKVQELAAKLKNEPGKLHAIKCNVRSEEEIVAAFEYTKAKIGPIHILINNAGLSHETTLSNGDAEKWRAVLETNVLGLSICTREALKDMKQNGVDGHVIHINSILGHYVAFVPDINMYSASKHAVTALTETLRQELLKSGTKIRISSVSPGPVDTNFTVVDKTVSSFPKLDSEDVADAVLYVLSTPPHVQVQDVLIRPLGEPV